MKPARRDHSRRVTPALLDFYIRRAHALREQYYRDVWRALRVWMRSIARR